jgi:adenylate cyclase
MEFAGKGELVPVGGGDAIPLPRSPLVMGRRESCDICLQFPNISGRHCELSFRDGFWIIRDLDSTNGIKVNGDKLLRGAKKALQPGDTLTIAKRQYTIHYTPSDRLTRMEELEEDEEDIMSVPLLEKAGLEDPNRRQDRPKKKIDRGGWGGDEGDDED